MLLEDGTKVADVVVVEDDVVGLLESVQITPPLLESLLTVAPRLTVSPASTVVGPVELTLTAGCVAVIVSVLAELVTPPADAAILVVPVLTPVARPLLLIVATPVALLAQVNVTPLMVFPPLSFAVAVNCWVAHGNCR